MSILLEAASPFLLLIPGFLPFLFFVHSRLVGRSSPAKPAPVICIFVSLLGPLAALAASLGIAVLELKHHARSIRVAQDITQSFVELGYRISILYLITPSSFAVLASRVSLSRRDIFRHNAVLAAILLSTFLISVIQASVAPSAIPRTVPLAMEILAALFPFPLAVHLTLSAQSTRIRTMWGFVSLLQMFSAWAVSLRIPQGSGYAVCSAMFTVLWGGGVILLFYTLSSVPLPSPSLQPVRLPKFSFPSSAPSTPVRVHYETPHVRQFSGALISEDFTALRDPFASPPPVSPIFVTTPILRVPSPVPTSTPRIILSPPPTPVNNAHRPPKPKARETKPQRRGVIKKTSSLGDGKRTSSQSPMQPVSGPADRRRWESWRASETGSENAVFLNDEALLSQILLNSLILDAAPASPNSSPQESSDTIDEESSIYSDSVSITTIRTRRDENGRRYASEELRYSDSGTTLQGVEEPGVLDHDLCCEDGR